MPVVPSAPAVLHGPGAGVTVGASGYVWTCAAEVARFDPMTEKWQVVEVGGGGCMEDDNAGLREVPLDLQVALELHYWEQCSVAEIAVALAIPVTAPPRPRAPRTAASPRARRAARRSRDQERRPRWW